MEQRAGKRYSAEFKIRAVERMRTDKNISALARELGVRRKFLYEWKQALEQGRGFPGVGHPIEKPVNSSEPEANNARDAEGERAKERISQLEALVGRLTLENRFFKSALQSIEELRQARSASSSAESSRKSKR